jgi:GTP cyclohydrolase IA
MMNVFAKKFEIEEKINALTIDLEEHPLSDSEKIKKIEFLFKEIMETLGLDLSDDSLQGTPLRVAKMYVKEIFSGLNADNFPKISLFKNTYDYHEMLIEKDIEIYSYCEHHFLPIVGKANVAYFPGENVIGLSKINRIVKYYAKRPQVQERLTIDIANALKEVLQTEDVAVHIEAKHFCVAARGAEDTKSSTVTSHLSGSFNFQQNKEAFLYSIKNHH